MRYGYQEYEEVKMLLYKYNIVFRNTMEYANYIKDLAEILNL